MSSPLSRPALIPVSLLVLGLFMLSGSPMTLAAGMVLFLVGGVVLTLTLVLWRERPPAAVAVVPNSWANSGFRNSSKRRTGF